jgi:hypothetical protein
MVTWGTGRESGQPGGENITQVWGKPKSEAQLGEYFLGTLLSPSTEKHNQHPHTCKTPPPRNGGFATRSDAGCGVARTRGWLHLLRTQVTTPATTPDVEYCCCRCKLALWSPTPRRVGVEERMKQGVVHLTRCSQSPQWLHRQEKRQWHVVHQQGPKTGRPAHRWLHEWLARGD